MIDISASLMCDGYKMDHESQFLDEARVIYDTQTARKSRISGVDKISVFGIQFYNQATLIDYWNENFFSKDINDITEEFIEEMTEYTLSAEIAKKIGVERWKDLHKLGYLPLKMKALKEGTLCPIRVAHCTIVNTDDRFRWLPGFIETDMQSETWGMITCSTLAHEYKKIFTKWANDTGGSVDFIPFQGHNFSYRGCFGRQAAYMVDMAHLTSFVGSDTIPGRLMLKKYYGAKQSDGIISCSVFATEHAVMCTNTGIYIKKNDLSWEKYGEAEFEVFKRLITETYPTGIVSIVSDTWDLWKVLTDYLPRLKKEILAREGKVVIRPDSGDPVDILCGTHRFTQERFYDTPQKKGVVSILWEIFGGTVNKKGFKELDPHIGCIYGDSITLERAENICKRLSDKSFVSTSWVAGIGSFTYQYITRDTLGIAQKATYAIAEINGVREGIDIFKDPVTDDGTKKSARGMVMVIEDENGELIMKDQVSPQEEDSGLLELVFLNGKMINPTTLNEVRKKLDSYL